MIPSAYTCTYKYLILYLGIHQVAEALVSIRRLEKFMMLPELSQSPTTEKQVATESLSVYLKNVNARWNVSKNCTLQHIDLSVQAGSFIAVIGSIGSGKSSLLQAILRELPLEHGTLEVSGKISFADQKPWIFASSVKQNILFGQPMDDTRYKEVLRVCQLERDLATMPHSDRTMVGERGMNLSGGQRARINLARAIYANADIYLLDDPLSAVDPQVGSRIVDDCILGYLKEKTRILVTHQIQYLKSADQIIVLNNGSILARGNFEELQSMNLDFMKIFEDLDGDTETMESGATSEKRCLTMPTVKPEESVSSEEPVEVAETRAFGQVSIKVFLAYWKASKNYFLLALMVFLFIASQMFQSGSDYWVAFWVNTEVESWITSVNGTQVFEWSGPLSRKGIIYIYSGFVVGIVVIYMFETFSYYGVCMRASKNLHGQMFRSIVRCVMYFYNTNPAGRILNR